MKEITIDIETLPAEKMDLNILHEIEQSKSKKKDDAKALDPKSLHDEYVKTALTGDYGRVLCIGYAIDNQQFSINGVLGWDDKENKFINEKETLESFWNLFVQFNI